MHRAEGQGTMGLDEAARHELYEELAATIGDGPTETLMSYLPPTGWSDVAGRRDVDHLGAVLRGEVDQFGAQLRHEMSQLRGELRGEMSQLRGELRGEMSELRGEMSELREGLRGEMSELRGDMAGFREEYRGELGALRVEMADRFRQQTLALVATMVTLSGVVGTAAALL